MIAAAAAAAAAAAGGGSSRGLAVVESISGLGPRSALAVAESDEGDSHMQSPSYVAVVAGNAMVVVRDDSGESNL